MVGGGLVGGGGRPKAVLHLFLYVMGALHWLVFLDFGSIPMGLLDWKAADFSFRIIRNALDGWLMPFHTASTYYFGTDRVFSLPYIFLAPYGILLKWIEPPLFALVHVLVSYSIGYLGTMLIARKYRLQWPGLLAFWLLFNFNGHITSNIAVSVLNWAGYFYLPFFLLLLFHWVETRPTAATAAGIASVVFLISLTGAHHLCNWCMLFIGLLGFYRFEWLKYAALTALLAAGLAAYRILPALTVFPDLKFGSAAGYPTLQSVFAGFLELRPPNHPTLNAMGWWEYDMFTGTVGLGILLFMGIPALFRHKTAAGRENLLRPLWLPAAAMTFLSYKEVYWWTLSALPALGGERVVTRLLILPLVVVAMSAVLRLNETGVVIKSNKVLRCAGACILGLLALDLARHSWTWRISAMRIAVPHSEVSGIAADLVSRNDPIYVACALTGMGISLVMLGVVLAIGWKKRSEIKRWF